MAVVDTVTGELLARRTLAECEAVVEKGLDTFVEVGEALMEIRDGRLYRDTFNNFEAYCRTRWGINPRYANRLVKAAEVVGGLGPMGPKPTTERQARELAPLRDQPEQMAAAMEQATDTAEAEGRKVTAADVANAVSGIGAALLAKKQREAAPKPRPLTEDEQYEADLIAADKRTARAIEGITERWPYLESLRTNDRREQVLALLAEPDRVALARIEGSLK